jgi:hypothetical protein
MPFCRDALRRFFMSDQSLISRFRPGFIPLLSLLVCLIFLICIGPGVTQGFAAQVTLAWDANTDPAVAGYKLYYGTASRTYGKPVDVSNVTQYTLTGIQEGVNAYFAITAYDANRNESAFSNEVNCFMLVATPGGPGFQSLFAASIASSGIWAYNSTSTTWTQITSSNPESVVASGSVLYGDFGASGIWMWSGGDSTAWTQITSSNPESVVASGSVLYGDFGASGIWMWSGGDSTAWTQITSSNPESVVASGSVLYGDFGASGIWMWDGSAWTQITYSNPESVVSSGSVLYGDFGASGIWMWDGSAWTRITYSNPESIVSSGSVLYGDFGASGIWMWDGSAWTQITSSNPIIMAVSN